MLRQFGFDHKMKNVIIILLLSSVVGVYAQHVQQSAKGHDVVAQKQHNHDKFGARAHDKGKSGSLAKYDDQATDKYQQHGRSEIKSDAKFTGQGRDKGKLHDRGGSKIDEGTGYERKFSYHTKSDFHDKAKEYDSAGQQGGFFSNLKFLDSGKSGFRGKHFFKLADFFKDHTSEQSKFADKGNGELKNRDQGYDHVASGSSFVQMPIPTRFQAQLVQFPFMFFRRSNLN